MSKMNEEEIYLRKRWAEYLAQWRGKGMIGNEPFKEMRPQLRAAFLKDLESERQTGHRQPHCNCKKRLEDRRDAALAILKQPEAHGFSAAMGEYAIWGAVKRAMEILETNDYAASIPIDISEQ